MHLTPELLDAMVLLNAWARGSGRQYAETIYAVKNRFLARYRDRGWSFRTSVHVNCRSCYGRGHWTNFNECWNCGGSGKVALSFVVTEFHIECGRMATFHTPRHLSGLTEEEWGKLQMVPPGDWTPNQPGTDLDKAAGIALLLQMESAVLPYRPRLENRAAPEVA